MRTAAYPDEMVLFAGVWLACGRKAGGSIGLVGDRPRHFMRDPFDESLVEMLDALADAVPGAPSHSKKGR